MQDYVKPYIEQIEAFARAKDEPMELLLIGGLAFNIGDNISGWGIVPLPSNYRERAKTVHSSTYLTLKILDPIDFVFSKLMRGTEEDLRDILDVIQRFNITKDALCERERLIQFP